MSCLRKYLYFILFCGGEIVMYQKKELFDCLKDIREKMNNNSNERFYSWEHCYRNFAESRKSKKDIDYLSLQLAFYLASWGMYRGSSFLLQMDYKVHSNAVRIIMDSKYDDLLGIDFEGIISSDMLEKLFYLVKELKNYYAKIRRKINMEVKGDISDILITKILLGTLGCVPAYDECFTKGIKVLGVSKGKFNKDSILKIAELYKSYKAPFENMRKKFSINNNLIYPQMKIIDMAFWQFGYNVIESEKSS